MSGHEPTLAEFLPRVSVDQIRSSVELALQADWASPDGELVSKTREGLQQELIALGTRKYLETPWIRQMTAVGNSGVLRGIYDGDQYTESYKIGRAHV